MALQPRSTFALWLHAFRHDGESERSFANRMGIDQRTLRRIYEGNVVHQSTLLAIAAAIKLPPEEVFKHATESQPSDGLNNPSWIIARIVDGLHGLDEPSLADVLRYVLGLLAKRGQ